VLENCSLNEFKISSIELFLGGFLVCAAKCAVGQMAGVSLKIIASEAELLGRGMPLMSMIGF
jgi:hypothetical protein